MALVEETGAGAASDDPEALLNEWLGELNILTAGLNTSNNADTALRPLEIVAPRIDTYRFSMANLEETQDADLDAILGELCALDSECDDEISRVSSAYPLSLQKKVDEPSTGCSQRLEGVKDCSDAASSITRTDSPDNDSAFSDTVSMLSSESSASSNTSAKCKTLKLNLHQNQKDTNFQQKADKIKLALERMREANIKKLFIKAFSMDGSSKSLLVDEKMTCGYVTRLLADKNHVSMEPKWAVVEHLPDLHMERVYEDHEVLVDNLMLWTRESKNKILFAERPDKISLFQTPEKFLLTEDDRGWSSELDEHSRQVILEEFFGHASTAPSIVPLISGHSVPPIEGPLYLKSDAKKGWKKYHFVLRPSGLYYSPKDKAKTLKELVCLATFDTNEVYLGINWKKKYKSPTDHCFAIKHPRLQQPKSVKFIKFLCADDAPTLERWVTAMRIAKHGRQLLENYRSLVEELTQEDLDHLAHARSCSITSIPAKTNGNVSAAAVSSPAQSLISSGSSVANSDLSSGRHSRASSSSSSGCLSDGGTASESAFDCEFPMGTIKRKPSMKPNIPLTWMTRQLKEMAEKTPTETDSDGGTLTRRHRHSRTDDSTLTRHTSIESSEASKEASVPASPSRQLPSPTSYPAMFPPPSPPAVMFSSTLSLDSLPPPPPPEPLLDDLTGSQLSLPPPPPEHVLAAPPAAPSPAPMPLPVTPSPRPPSLDSLASSDKSLYGACLLELQHKKLNNGSPSSQKKLSILKKVNFAEEPAPGSPPALADKKKISFSAEAAGRGAPPPPRRDERTRLSAPRRLADSASNPPAAFLQDLQRVMRKKWQVAQVCLDPAAARAAAPPAVLGFREYPLHDHYKETSVSMWVHEHYGAGDPYYENIYSGERPAPSTLAPGSGPAQPSAHSTAPPAARRRPPPAPPRRADTTHLSTTAPHRPPPPHSLQPTV